MTLSLILSLALLPLTAAATWAAARITAGRPEGRRLERMRKQIESLNRNIEELHRENMRLLKDNIDAFKIINRK